MSGMTVARNSQRLRIYMKKYFLAILLTVLTTFAFSSRAGAVSDVSFTIDANSTFPYDVCSNSTIPNVPKCSDYSNVIFEPVSPVSNYYLTVNMYYFSARIPNYDKTILGLSGLPNTGSVSIPGQSSIFSGNFKLNVTLTNSLEPEPCPDPLPPDRSAIMDDFHNVFLKVFVGVIPISAIIFVVWFMIDMLSSLIFGRGR